ncbi:MAG: DUF4340 domain-containing protein [Planctomycetes bacterium]|nr:DUF4340 domain-containing protein [Planctomycetota bacterium]MCC7169994.1 DUF4340 domain-containing protein [Planctomycetota bacterium]
MNKLNTVLLIVLIGQGALVALDRFGSSEGSRPRYTVSGDKLFPDAKPDAVASFTLKRGNDVTELVRKGTSWVVASESDAAADQRAVGDLLGRLAEMKPGIVVAQNEAKHADFQVAGDQAVEFEAKSNTGATVAHFVLGKAATTRGASGVYLRTPVGAKEVILVASDSRHLFVRNDNTKGAWRDKTVFAIDPSTLRKFEIAAATETVVVERKINGDKPSDQDDWDVKTPVTGLMERYTGNSMAKYVAELKADGFYGGDKKASELGLEPAQYRVTVTREGGEPLVFEIGNEDGNKRSLRVPGKPEIYEVMSYRLANLVRKGADFPEKRPEETAPKTDDAAAPAEAGTAPTDAPPADEPANDKPSGDGG